MKKKILIIGPLSKPITGIYQANHTLVQGCKQNQIEVELVDTNAQKVFENQSVQGRFKLKKVIMSVLPIIKGSFKLLFKAYDAVYITPAQSYIGFIKYVPFISLAKLKKSPVYLHIHGGTLRLTYDGVGRKKQQVMKHYLQMSEAVIILGESFKERFSPFLSKEKMRVCENGVQESFVLSEAQVKEKLERLKGAEQMELLYLSNLMEAKGVLELLEACKQLKAENFPFHLSLAGEIEPHIKAIIEKDLMILGDQVTYYGSVDGEDKKQLLNQACIFCLPISYPYEGQPIAILEAMGMGCAIVTTHQGGIKDIVKAYENGLICEVKNSSSIVAAIKSLKNNYETYILRNNEAIRSYYLGEHFVKRLFEIFSFEKEA